MPTCNKCDTAFPNRMVIDGKTRILSTRKYCLTCSPFGGHNTKQLVPSVSSDTTCTCNICMRDYIYSKSKANSKKTCNTCLTRTRRAAIKQRAVEYKGGNCHSCGYCKNQKALQFHHIDPEGKDFSISGTIRSWETTVKELDKCIMLCANCHIEAHDLMGS